MIWKRSLKPSQEPAAVRLKPRGTSGSLTGEGLKVLVQSLVEKALEAESTQPGTSGTSGSLMGEGLKVLVQSLVE